jgi:hypothetical protein
MESKAFEIPIPSCIEQDVVLTSALKPLPQNFSLAGGVREG